jgi:hypothetical protein
MRADQQHFVVTFVAAPGTDGIRSLRALLKRSLRAYGLRCVDAREQAPPDEPAIGTIEQFRGLTSPSRPHGA